MTTRDDLMQVFELVQAPVNVLLQTIQDQHYDICMLIDWYDMHMAKGLRFKPRSSREKCEEAAEKLEARFRQNLEEQAKGLDHIEDYDCRLRPLYRSYQEMKTKVRQHPLFKQLYMENFTLAGVDHLPVDFYAEGTDSITELEANERAYPNACFPYKDVQMGKNTVLFQHRLRLLLSKLPRSVQQELIIKWSPKSPIELELTTKPEVEVEQRPVRCLEGVKTKPFRLPIELMGLLYSVADLETCVDLREVSSEWYTAFKRYGDCMENTVRSRTLGLQPGENGSELQSWGDCALVFVGRLRNAKWEKVDHSQAYWPHRSISSTHTLVSIEIDGKLPQDYTGLVNEPPVGIIDASSVSDIHQNWQGLGSNYALNPETLKFHRTPDLHPRDFNIQFQDSEIVCVEYRDSLFTIPAYMKRFTKIVANHEAVVFCCEEAEIAYLLPRRFPDYRQEKGFSFPLYRSEVQVSSFDAPIMLRREGSLEDLFRDHLSARSVQ